MYLYELSVDFISIIIFILLILGQSAEWLYEICLNIEDGEPG